MGVVKVALLGGFAAEVDGTPVPNGAWRLKKARELVKLLALAPGHRLHREQVMDVLWRDRDPASAANNLHQALHAARRALTADAIELRNEVLVLDAEVDIDRFELAARNARHAATPAAFRAALAQYGGELLPENRYDDWADDRRDALAALAEELSAEAAALGNARTFSLPADASSFVGRSRELAELRSLLRRTRLLTLAGTGGVGKTRLALELARSAEEGFDEGAALVELAPVGDSRRVLDAIAGALDVRALPDQDLLEVLTDFVSPRRMLLVLDNCEHVLDTVSGVVSALLRGAPELTVVATSREPLRVPGEVVFRVPSLAIPDPEAQLAPDRLIAFESVSLFAERAAEAAPGFVVDETNAAAVARICFRLDGLPLALELAAGRLGGLSAAAIAERLDARFRLLRSGGHAAPTRQQTLTAALQWSHDLLEPDEVELFRRLGVFAGGFELETVEEVCDAGAADVLARLAEKSLVAVDERGRYRLLETVRLYALERLTAAGERAAVERAHAEWALALAEREERGSPRLDREAANLRLALATLSARDPAAALRLCVALLPFWLRRIELDEARGAFADALARAPVDDGLRIPALLAASAIEYRAGGLARGIELAEEAHRLAAASGDAYAEWRAVQFLGEFAVAEDDADVAVAHLESALALARSHGLAAAEAISVHALGVAAWVAGDLASAERLIAESVAAFRVLEESTGTIPSPMNIAELRTTNVDDRPGVRHVFEDTLQLFFEVSCSAAASYALANQAGIARVRGNLDEARALLDESAQRFERGGDRAGLATVLVRRAYTALAGGDVPAAHAHLESALAIRDELRDRRGRALVLAGLGLVETGAGDFEAADRHLSEARDVFRRAGDRWGYTSTLWRCAELDIARGRLDAAEAALLEARATIVETGRASWLAGTLTGLAEVAILRGDVERARSLLADARGQYEKRRDALGAAAVDDRLEGLLRARKGTRDTTGSIPRTKGRPR